MDTSNAVFVTFFSIAIYLNIIFEPTHVKGNVLDLIVTSISSVVKDLIVHPLSVFDCSDHSAVSFDICCNVS